MFTNSCLEKIKTLFAHIKLNQASISRLFIQQFEFFKMKSLDIANVAQPVINESVFNLPHRLLDTTTTMMTTN